MRDDCSTCVTSKEHDRVHRQWVRMCWLCIFLIASTAAFGVLMLDAKTEVSALRQDIDNATGLALKRERLVEAQAKMLRNRPVKTRVVYKEVP